MVDQSTIETTVSCAVAVVLIIGFTAAPAAALQQDSVLDDGVGVGDVPDLDTTEAGDSSTEGVKVEIVDTNSPVQTGETLKVTVDVVTNGGGSAELLIDGSAEDSRNFPPGQEDRVKFTWDTSYTDSGEHNATVQSGADNDSTTVQVELGADAPQEACTNVPKQAHENIPYEQLPWQDDLPEDAPRPIPGFLGYKAVAGIVLNMAPNQCEIQDPSDPSVDPTDPPSDPDADVTVLRQGQFRDGGVVWITYEATLDKSSGGPGVSGDIGAIAYSGGVNQDSSATLDDGAQEYSVNPRFDGDTSTAGGTVTVSAPFGTVRPTMECYGGECHFSTPSLPSFAEYPAIPAPIWDGEN